MRVETDSNIGRQCPNRPYPSNIVHSTKVFGFRGHSFLKGKSAIKILDMNTELKRRYWGRHFWAKGYCVSTIGLDEEQIRKYVRWQLHKDRKYDQQKLWQNA